MLIKLFTLWVTASLLLFAGTDYFVDSENGKDTNDGLSDSSPWRTLSKINSLQLQPGDEVHLKKGSHWREQLNLTSSGSPSQKILISSYGSGNTPVISGANVVKNFQLFSGNIWSAPWTLEPQQLFINNIRGEFKQSAEQLNEQNNWYYDSLEKTIYLYTTVDPSNSVVEATWRQNAIKITGSNITVQSLQLEKVYRCCILISGSSSNVTVNNITFYQWSNGHINENSAVESLGKNTEVMNCTLGKNTGSDIEDENWAGIEGIVVKNGNAFIHNNSIYHSAIENESPLGIYSHGIYVDKFTGTVKIYNNYVYHTGSHGIRVSGYSNKGDSVFIFNNTVEYAGQAGIAGFKTRGGDGIGGTGFIYNNHVSFSNRLGGDIGGNGSQSCGIHLNDGVIENTELLKPFIKWYVYENIVHDSQAPADPGSEDSGGIIADFNANGAEIYRNLIYNNWGKGISLWNSNGCKVYYNIVFGNDMGIVASASNNSSETCNNHWIYNNTFYKNFNGNDKGSNLNTEIYFGKNGQNNRIENNIFYSADSGYAYTYNTINASGILLDHNIVYKENDERCCYDTRNRAQTFDQWRTRYSQWDRSSLNKFPEIHVSFDDVAINADAPGIDKAANIGQVIDFKNNKIVGAPDIGAVEYVEPTGVTEPAVPYAFKLYDNFPNPFNPETTIRFSLNRKDNVSLVVYDILGTAIGTLMEGELEAGVYNVKFNPSDYNISASGVYLYTLKVGNASVTKKLILLK